MSEQTLTDSMLDVTQKTVGEHHGKATILVVVLLITVMVLAFSYSSCRTSLAACNKGSFGVRSVNNTTTGNLNPLWFHGGMDAGSGGSMHRSATGIQLATMDPSLRRTNAVEMEHMHQSRGDDMSHGRSGYGEGWSPQARAEAQALSTIGALSPDPKGEGKLQHVLASAQGGPHSALSDERLQELLHQRESSM